MTDSRINNHINNHIENRSDSRVYSRDLADIRDAVKKGELAPKKRFGQCFLNDAGVAERIVNVLDLAPDDHVIEAGPGACSLTGLLCERAGSVTAVELDRELMPNIDKAMARYSNFRLINADILRVPPESLLPEGGLLPKGRIKFISNMPYNISTPIMTRLFEEFAFVGKAALMMQSEVSDKVVAQPSTDAYCLLSVLACFFAVPERAFYVPPHCFTPQPGVGSAVVVFHAHGEAPEFASWADPVMRGMLFRVARAAFAQRRKTIENSLLHAGLAADRGAAADIVSRAGIRAGSRGEALSAGQFAALAHACST